MSWIRRVIGRSTFTGAVRHPRRFSPQPPPGFVRRSDPNFHWLSRKF